MRDGLRLALGTLTVLPTRPPRQVDRRVASWAMTLAPGVGALLALTVGGFVRLLELADAPPLLVAGLTVGLLTVLTRAIHLDGLADTADGLGSGRPSATALDIMRAGDIGPFGVVTLVLVLLLQVASLAELVATSSGQLGVAVALLTSRSLLPFLCARGVPAARPEGLGQLVAGSVDRRQLALAVVLAFLLGGALVLFWPDGASSTEELAKVTGAVAAGLGLGGVLGWACVRRLGGVTGDVLGACVETSFTAALVAAALC